MLEFFYRKIKALFFGKISDGLVSIFIRNRLYSFIKKSKKIEIIPNFLKKTLYFTKRHAVTLF